MNDLVEPKLIDVVQDILTVVSGGTVTGTSAPPATEAKQDTIITLLDAQASGTETQPVSLATVPLPAGAATETKQQALLTELQLKRDGTSTEPVFTTLATQVQTPAMTRTTTSGTTTANAIHISITNVGTADGTVTGAVLKSKETVHFTVTDRDAKLSAVSFNATGTEFVITTLQGA